MTFGRNATTMMMREKLRNAGSTYTSCVNALDRLRVEFFGCDTEQYGILSSYAAELKNGSHKVELDIVKNEFKRFGIIFREGIQAFRKYSEREFVLGVILS